MEENRPFVKGAGGKRMPIPQLSEERKSQEEQSYKEIIKFFETGREVKDVHNDPEYFDKDIDLLVSGENDYSIEIKFDDYLDKTTNNFFFEIISNEQLSTPGCFLKSQADVLLYYAKESHIGYFFPMKSLQNRFFDIRGDFHNMKEIDDNFVLKSTHIKGEDGKYHHTTIGRLIDKKLLFIGCDKKGINYFESNIIEDGIAPRGLDILFESGEVKEISDMEIEDIVLDAELFNSLEELTDKQAKAIAKLKDPYLGLNSLKKITDKQAKYLSEFGGETLGLNGLETITDKQAEYLTSGGYRGISLEGLQIITDKQIKILNERGGSIIINKKIKAIISTYEEVNMDKSRDDFSKSSWDLGDMPSYKSSEKIITSISNEELESLVNVKNSQNESLSLNGISSFTDEQLKIISKFEGAVSLCGLTNLSDNQASIISDFKCRSLSLNGITSLNNRQARELAKYKGRSLSLNGLKEISDIQLKLFIVYRLHNSHMSLSGLVRLTDEQIKILQVAERESLFLDGLESLTDNQVSMLCNLCCDKLSINIKKMTYKQALILEECEDKYFGINRGYDFSINPRGIAEDCRNDRYDSYYYEVLRV